MNIWAEKRKEIEMVSRDLAKNTSPWVLTMERIPRIRNAVSVQRRSCTWWGNTQISRVF